MLETHAEDSTEVSDGRTERRRDNAKRIYDAAMRLARKKGYQSMTAEDICQEAGVGRATFFRIYKAKSGLLKEFNRQLALQIDSRLQACDGETAAKLSIFADEIALAWQQSGAVLAAMINDYTSSTGQGASHWVHQEIFDLVVAIVAEGIEKNDLRGSMPAPQLGSLMFYQINIAVAEASLSGETDLQALANEALECLLNGVATR